MLIGPISFHGRWGYLDEIGQIRIPFIFEDLGSFSEGVAWFLEKGKIGFVSEQYEIVIPPIFDRGARLSVISDFRSGLAPVRLGTQEGYIDHSGVFQIPCRFELCSRFVGEIALVSEDEHGYSVIDRRGKRICRLPFADVAEAPYEPDLIKVYPRIAGTVAPAFVNRNGIIVAGPFSNLEEVYYFGQRSPFYAVARSRGSGLFGFLNRQWQTAIPFKFVNATDFGEGMAAASTQDYLWGYIDPEGNWAIAPEYTAAHLFYNGTASVRKGRRKTEKWLVINKQNQQISPGFYDGVWDFENGFRWVSSGKVAMLLDLDCNVIWSGPISE